MSCDLQVYFELSHTFMPKAGMYAHTCTHTHACTHTTFLYAYPVVTFTYTCTHSQAWVHAHMHTHIYMIVLNQILTLIFPFSCIPRDLCLLLFMFFSTLSLDLLTLLSLSSLLLSTLLFHTCWWLTRCPRQHEQSQAVASVVTVLHQGTLLTSYGIVGWCLIICYCQTFQSLWGRRCGHIPLTQ